MSYGTIFQNKPSQKIEQLNIEAARIVTGATKLVSLNALYRETGWETLKKTKGKQANELTNE